MLQQNTDYLLREAPYTHAVKAPVLRNLIFFDKQLLRSVVHANELAQPPANDLLPIAGVAQALEIPATNACSVSSDAIRKKHLCFF